MLYVCFDDGYQRIEPGELLFHDDFTDPDLTKKWEVPRGEWVSGNGCCVGTFRENAGGLIYTLQQFPGDIMLDFYGTMVGPCRNDLNFTYRARGWNYQTGHVDTCYISGLNGWFLDRAGIERYPGMKLQALCEGFTGEADREYHIQAGIVGTNCFLAVDGKMLLTLADPDPINEPDCNRVGLGTYCSRIRFRDFKIYRPTKTYVPMSYTPNF